MAVAAHSPRVSPVCESYRIECTTQVQRSHFVLAYLVLEADDIGGRIERGRRACGSAR